MAVKAQFRKEHGSVARNVPAADKDVRTAGSTNTLDSRCESRILELADVVVFNIASQK